MPRSANLHVLMFILQTSAQALRLPVSSWFVKLCPCRLFNLLEAEQFLELEKSEQGNNFLRMP